MRTGVPRRPARPRRQDTRAVGLEATLASDNARSAAEAAVEASARSQKENEKQWLGGRAIGIHDEADANEAALGHEAQFNDCDESGEESDGE